MGAGEDRSLERGCCSAWVDTSSFLAPAFYRKPSYDIFGGVDYPPDHKRFFPRKRLVPRLAFAPGALMSRSSA